MQSLFDKLHEDVQNFLYSIYDHLEELDSQELDQLLSEWFHDDDLLCGLYSD